MEQGSSGSCFSRMERQHDVRVPAGGTQARRRWLRLLLAGAALLFLLVACDGLGGAERSVIPAPRTRATAHTARTTPIVPTPMAPSASPTPQPGFVTAMETCVRDEFGQRLDLREVGILDGATRARLELPPERQEELEGVSEEGGGDAGYGITIEGGTAIVQPMAPDDQPRANATNLCYLQFISVHGTFTDAGSALTLLLITFPGVPQDAAGYTVVATQDGFTFSRRSESLDGTPRKLMLEAYRAPEGRLILSANSRRGF